MTSSFIDREILKIRSSVVRIDDQVQIERLLDIQQALAWTLDPDNYKSPLRRVMGTQEDTADYCGLSGPAPFSSKDSRTD